MKTFLLACAFIAASAGLASAQVAPSQRPSGLGLGFAFGDPFFNVTGKYFINPTGAIQATLGFDQFAFHGDYLWHGWNAFPQPNRGRLAAILGLGLQAESHNWGPRGTAGAGYWFDTSPVEAFFELSPIAWVQHDRGVELTASMGFRYYFSRFN
jgi:hypothetical protein